MLECSCVVRITSILQAIKRPIWKWNNPRNRGLASHGMIDAPAPPGM